MAFSEGLTLVSRAAATTCVLWAVGCVPSPAIETKDGAPWTMPEWSKAYWIREPHEYYGGTMGFLVISGRELSCVTMDWYGGGGVAWEVERVKGIIFYLGYEPADPLEPYEDLDWSGCHTGGTEQLADGAEWELTTAHFENGEVVEMGLAAAMLCLDSYEEGLLAASFETEYWDGDVDVLDCGVYTTIEPAMR